MALFRRLKEKNAAARTPFCSAVVPAAGTSSRMEGVDKILEPLAGEAVIVHTLRALQTCQLVGEIIVVTREDLMLPIADLCKAYALDKVVKIVVGGDTRLQSVRIGTLEISPRAELIAVHDGARPLVSQAVLEEVILRAAECHAAAPAVPVKDTVKQASGGIVDKTLPRDQLFAVQTPQVFDSALLKAALEKALTDGQELTDDCSAVERLGMTVMLTRGDDTNLKLTTPADFWMAEGILEGRALL